MQRRWITAGVATLGGVALLLTSAVPAHADPSPRTDAARETLAAGDGWASAGAGTTGGSTATPEHVFTVDDRAGLVAAVAGDEPKIVYVSGVIDANTDGAGAPLTCADYARGGYTLDAYLAAYDPAVWGWDSEPSGPVEAARAASQAAQRERIDIRVGANTTLIGLPGAEITGAALQVANVSNVVIRGLTLTNAFDCFPSWDPTDGETGNWNSEWDLLTVTGSTNVWIDHNDLSDGGALDSLQPSHFGRPFQIHDGLLDVVRAADLVTISWNRFHDHDKVMLIGNSDSRTTDRGHLRVTLHHNEFRDLGQRAPRVRFGQVDAYNNHYVQSTHDQYPFVYSWGLGIESKLVAEQNAFTVTKDFDPAAIIEVYKGTAISESGNVVNLRPADVLGAYNESNGTAIADDAGWTPEYRGKVHPAVAVPALVSVFAGPPGLR
ncbi:pectate lyase [Agromyces sp. 3263]|uniref:pectate lyase family protein n=1 Tax=Agromyces sp. 3263 TaxID=2817750 RepID=UPI00285E4C9F|nr:polysaccharide lyase family 1 protein [Agromyces sp. 3263]MDR6904326.1 pectate lyase [Agromyces sp. 3263]